MKCWDADLREEVLRSHPECLGVIKPTLSLEELKGVLLERAITEGRSNFNIYREAMNEIVPDEVRWVPEKSRKELCINFCSLQI